MITRRFHPKRSLHPLRQSPRRVPGRSEGNGNFSRAVRLIADYAMSVGHNNARETEGVARRAKASGIPLDSWPEFVILDRASAFSFLDDLAPRDAVHYGFWEGDYTEEDHDRVRSAVAKILTNHYSYVDSALRSELKNEIDDAIVSHVRARGVDVTPAALRKGLNTGLYRHLATKYPQWEPSQKAIDAVFDISGEFKHYKLMHRARKSGGAR